jgi:hypothetical protein
MHSFSWYTAIFNLQFIFDGDEDRLIADKKQGDINNLD